MGSPLDISATGLRAFQRALQTTSNNIANAATEGYSRQRVEITSRTPQAFGDGFIGTGARVADITRIESEFFNNQVRSAATESSRLEIFNNLASRVDNLLADGDGSLSPALQNFFNSLQDLSNDPNSGPARQVVLSAAESLVTRFKNIDGQLRAIDSDVDTNLTNSVRDINSIAANIADLNRKIVEAQALSSNGQKPNELLDQRDLLVLQLSELVSADTLDQPDGSVNVFIGKGQSLVVGGNAEQITTIRDPQDASKIRVAYVVGGGQVDITDQISGGELAGLLEFRSELSDYRNELGRTATVLADTFNQQHRMGQTLNGSLGQDFFSVGVPNVIGNQLNTGAATVTASITDVTALTASDYEVEYDGANFILTRLNDGTTQVSGAGTFNVDGLQISVAGAAAAGDRFLVQPTLRGSEQIGVLLATGNDVAAASPVRTSIAVNNLGDGVISAPQVTDVTNPDLRDRVEIRFNSPASTFDVFNVTDGATIASGVAYTSGSDISFNGITVQVSGTPGAGDVFVVENNTGSVSDNTNVLQLFGLQTANTIEGASSYQGSYGALVGTVGTVTRQSEINSDAQARLLQDAIQARESISGVNLDEEAINLTRYQQAYQAAAQVIATSNTLFQTLIGVVAR